MRRRNNEGCTEMKMGIRRGDVLLSAALLVIAAALFAHFVSMPTPSKAVIEQNGSVAHTIALPAQHALYEVEGEGCNLTIEVDRSRARVLASDCPDQVCVRTGWLTRSSRMAVCLPAKVVLRVEGEAPDVDAVLR